MHPLHHVILCVFIFAFGASVGSFLNVVVWRLPRGKSLVSPPSHCPRCQHKLAWYDNIPVFGWIFLKGRCRYCSVPISARYPIVEFITGALFVFFYVMFFIAHVSPCAPTDLVRTDELYGTVTTMPRVMRSIVDDWPMYVLFMFMVAGLLAISLIDAELYIIPLQIPWLMAFVGALVHALADGPNVPGAVMVTDPTGLSGALAAGGIVGLGLSLLLFRFGLIPQSFPEGEPALEIDDALFQEEVERARAEGLEPPQKPRTYTRQEIRAEIRKEITFLLPPMIGGLAFVAVTQMVPSIKSMWLAALKYYWFSGLLGSILGALVGALVVWTARIFGTLAFGRVAMGLGDVHLMFGAGAIVGAGAATVAFFLAPFAGILVGLYGWLTQKKHELPYGPYLSLATVAVLLFYCPIAEWMAPGMAGLGAMIRDLVGIR